MKNNLTEMLFILDKSGSMYDMTGDVIGNFNATIDKQKQEEGDCLVSTILFSDESQVLHDRKALCEIEKMTQKDYQAGGCTALYDAVGDALHHIGNVHKYARQEDVPQKTVVVIITDGMENASSEYSAKSIRRMIADKKQQGWEFIFLGANIDAERAAEDIGIDKEFAVSYHCDASGMRSAYASVNHALRSARMGGIHDMAWRSEADADFNGRG